MAEGKTRCPCNSCFFLIVSFYLLVPTLHSLSPLLGVHPLDGNYFASQVIKCKDGSKSFTRDRLNDNFCDCVDGTDEPGTSACPRGRFYCRNLGSTPQFIHSSRINDRICDCCDGSDEYDSAISCPNTCIMGGNLDYKTRNNVSTNQVKESKTEVNSDDLLHKIKGLRMILILQVVILGCVAIFRICYRRGRSKTRRHHQRFLLFCATLCWPTFSFPIEAIFSGKLEKNASARQMVQMYMLPKLVTVGTTPSDAEPEEKCLPLR